MLNFVLSPNVLKYFNIAQMLKYASPSQTFITIGEIAANKNNRIFEFILKIIFISFCMFYVERCLLF